MDVRAFGSIYGQTASLPYGSGLDHALASGRIQFPACRAIFVEGKSSGAKGYITVTPTDMQGQEISFHNLAGDMLIPMSCTAISGGTMNHVVVLW